MVNKAKLNLVVDAIILVTFIAATISGLVLLTMPHGAFAVAGILTSLKPFCFWTKPPGMIYMSGAAWR